MSIVREISKKSRSITASATKLSFSSPFSDVSFARQEELEYKATRTAPFLNLQNLKLEGSLGLAKAKNIINAATTSSANNKFLASVLASNDMSFSSPEADFNCMHAPSMLEPISNDASLSFASPESDFVANHTPEEYLNYSVLTNQSSINFASAESDFTSPSQSEIRFSEAYAIEEEKLNGKFVAFTSPESDFVSMHAPSFLEPISNNASLSFASAESDFVANHIPEEYMAVRADSKLSFVSPESDFVAENTFKAVTLDMLIPKTLQGALSSKKAVVITECVPPFKITHVNAAWENLCGFSKEEAIGKTPRELLNGPLTQNVHLRGFTRDIKSSKMPSQVVLTNYNKRKETFENRLTIAPFSINGTIEATHYLAVLEPLNKANV